MIKVFLNYLLTAVFLVLLQVLVLNNIQLNGYINPYIYIMFILTLPFEIPKWTVLFIAFTLGISVDMLSLTPGMHSAACVFLAFIRPSILKLVSPRDGYESGTQPRIKYYGLSWFIKYTIILVLAHHFVLFFVEAFKFTSFFYTFLRVILSTVFSSILIIGSQYFMFKR